jgi:hypothetical protein
MTSKYRIAVGPVVEFTVKFTLRDGPKDKPFGMRLTANRADPEEITQDFASEITVGNFIKARNVTMQAWVGDSPLVDEANQPAPANAETLQAAMEIVPAFPRLLLDAYLEANGAKGKQGN